MSGSALCFIDRFYNNIQLGPYDGIEGRVKRLVYQDVSSRSIVIDDTQQFVNEADKLCKITSECKYKLLFYF